LEHDGTLQLVVYADCKIVDEHEDTSESLVDASKEFGIEITTK
jgi:hypothetical protein